MPNFMTENRLGRFNMPFDTIKKDPASVAYALRDMIIIEATHSFRSNSIEYLAYCPRFASNDNGLTYPWYDVIVTENTNIEFQQGSQHRVEPVRTIRSLAPDE